jgi:uroporphyrin-III C-methyltransferase
MKNEQAGTTASDLPVATNHPPTAPRRFTALILLAVCGLIGAAAWWAARVYAPERARITDALASSDRAYTGLGAQVQSLHAKLDEVRASTGSDTDRLAKLETTVAAISAQLAAPQTNQEHALIAARVTHLVALADAELRFEKDPILAAAALASAAEVLADSQDAVYDALKTALSSDRNALLTVAQPDVGALAVTWAEHAALVERLVWRQPTIAAPTSAPSSTSLSGWQGVIVAMWHDLKALVEVRDRQVTDDAMLDPGRDAAVRDALRAELATLRFAIYRRDAGNVKAASTRIKQLLSTYFATDDPSAAQLNQALNELDLLELDVPLPDLAATHTALEYLRRGAVSATVAAPDSSLDPQ